ncbi:activated protein kinase catalytic subunit alpha-1 [Seminavis robusta]|uniref:guanylate cyclase n=1 Tax=Seminavis robusta TaxID=568900 RepID=A0A9N8DWV6_9STRA|nr:activated protein kinase catalytic subunit alpha-1 [Seminavis robusta]
MSTMTLLLPVKPSLQSALLLRCLLILIIVCSSSGSNNFRNAQGEAARVPLAEDGFPTTSNNGLVVEDPNGTSTANSYVSSRYWEDPLEYPDNYCPPPPLVATASNTTNSHNGRVYRVGVLAIRGEAQAYASFNTTFGDYLTSTAGSQLSGVSFEMVPLNFVQTYSLVENQQVDFIYLNPSAFSCMESEHGAQSLLSIITRHKVAEKTYDLTRFGGVIATLQNNTAINSIQDLKDKVIAAASISGLGSGQMQFREMQRAGLSYIQDPKQLVFTSNQGKIVQGLLDGHFEVGFIRTDQLEHSHGQEPVQDFLQRFKIINPQPPQTLDNGIVFPFVSSTEQLYPEWNIAALPHVPEDVSFAVVQALMAIQKHAQAGFRMQQCELAFQNHSSTSGHHCDSLPLSVFLEDEPHNKYPCDTTRTIAQLAHAAMMAGGYAGWRTTLSYMPLRSMHEATGFIRIDTDADQWKCVRHNSLYDAITCPEGHLLKTPQQVQEGCASRGLECQEGYQCVCKPCKTGYDVDVFGVDNTNDDGDDDNHVGCAKMSLCASTLHHQPLTLRAMDNRQRDNQTMGVVLHAGEESNNVPVGYLGNYVYEFNIGADFLGVTTLEIYLGGTQIAESPLRVIVSQKDCVAERGSQHFEPNVDGECVCKGQYVTLGGSCISIFILLPALFAPFGVMVALTSFLYVQQKRREADSIWEINPDDLLFAQPPVVLGQGTFGVVWLADYHGTKVAVKKVLPPRNIPPATTTISSHGQGGNAEVCDIENDWSGLELFSWRQLRKQTSRLYAFCFEEPDRYERLKQDFKKEMRLLSKLRHPCVTCVLGAVVSHETEPLLVMEHMSFGSLYDLLHNETVVLEGEILLVVMRDIAQGLRFLHSSDPAVVHGDMKSRNVLISAAGFRAKVADFGLSQKTKNGHACGTPYFMGPELLLGNPNSTASDMYSIGVVLWELYSRKNPYEGLNAEAVLRLVCDPLVNKRPMVPASCPPQIFELMKQCWKPDPRERPTAEDLDERLKCLHVENIEPTNAYNPLRKRPSNSGPLDKSLDWNDRHSVLYEKFPKHVANALARGEKVEPESHDSVSIVFVEVAGLSQIAGICPAMLDKMFQLLDDLAHKHGLFTVQTIGDGYLAVANLMGNQPDHTKRAAEFALDAVAEAGSLTFGGDVPEKRTVQIKVGFHAGPVVTSLVGSVRPRFSLFGQSVSLASNLGSQSKPQKIQCSGYTRDLLCQQAPDIVVHPRGEVDMKGKGRTKTYWVVSARPEE